MQSHLTVFNSARSEGYFRHGWLWHPPGSPGISCQLSCFDFERVSLMFAQQQSPSPVRGVLPSPALTEDCTLPREAWHHASLHSASPDKSSVLWGRRKPSSAEWKESNLWTPGSRPLCPASMWQVILPTSAWVSSSLSEITLPTSCYVCEKSPST